MRGEEQVYLFVCAFFFSSSYSFSFLFFFSLPLSYFHKIVGTFSNSSKATAKRHSSSALLTSIRKAATCLTFTHRQTVKMDQKGGSQNTCTTLKSGGSQKNARKSASRNAQKRGLSAARSPASPSKRASTASAQTQKTSATPSQTATKEERGSSVVTAASTPGQITANALASINYAAFNHSSLSAKQRRTRMLKDFLAAHNTGAQQIIEEWEEEHQALWSNYLQSSHAPHSREIARLTKATQQIEQSCQQRLQHANAITRCALGGIEMLLTRLTECGTQISADTRVLSGELDPVLAGDVAPALSPGHETVSEHGTPMEEVRGFDPSKPDPHPPAFRFSEADREEVERLKNVFARAVESITARRENGSCADAAYFSSPLKPTTADELAKQSNETCPRNSSAAASPVMDGQHAAEKEGIVTAQAATTPVGAAAAADAERLRQVEELQRELNAVGRAFISLMQRVELQHQQYQAKIKAQRDALDAEATRTKLADDVLRGTVAQGEAEACSAVVEVRQLSLELRQRMDASEAAMQAALDTLIKESAEVCVANGALHDYAALTLNRENCLYAYMSRMERQVVEQASVLREAQDTVTRLWTRLHTPASSQRPQQSTSKQSGKTLSSSATPTKKSDSDRIASDVSSSLPPLYEELLRQSDRASLLELAERLAQHGPDVATVIVRALDEQQAHGMMHPAEAAAAREMHLRTIAVQQLLEKLDAEGHLRSNARQTTQPLSERIAHLVSQYDAYVDFNEQYARALVRQADVERREHAPSQFAFFDPRTPAPGQQSTARTTPAKPANTLSVPKTYASVSSVETAAAGGAATTAAPSSLSPVSLPYLQLWKSKQQASRQRERGMAAAPSGCGDVGPATSVDSGHIIKYLDRTTAHASPVFGGIIPSPPHASTGGGGGGSSGALLSAPRARRHTIVSATASTCESSTPPPPIPPRAGLTSYVLSTCTEKNAAVINAGKEAAAPSTSTGQKPGSHVLPYRDGDRQFIERQREVFQQLD